MSKNTNIKLLRCITIFVAAFPKDKTNEEILTWVNENPSIWNGLFDIEPEEIKETYLVENEIYMEAIEEIDETYCLVITDYWMRG